MFLVNSNTAANETDSACRGPKGEKVDSGGESPTFVKRCDIDIMSSFYVLCDRVTMAIREYAD